MKKALFQRLRRNQFTSGFAALLALRKKSNYLAKAGWFTSFQNRIPLDANGFPLPWYTYAAVDFLDHRIDRKMAIFEFGSGNSTLWWARRVSKVVSCEHDKRWYLKLKPELPPNVDYIQQDYVPGGEYSKTIMKYDNEFDLIIVDGKDRILCAQNSLQALKKDGVVIWDNSDLEQYREGFDWLVEHTFKRIDFSGIGPVNAYGWCTSIFYRPMNCLGI